MRALGDDFWSKVDKSAGPMGCWLWTGGRTGPRSDPYGEYGRGLRAHRLAWEEANGRSVPSGLFICHRCDVRLCVNPAHLYAGSHVQNMRDARERGRTASGDRNGMRTHPERRARGERQGSARLTESDVVDIRARRARGERPKDIAERYGIVPDHVRQIVVRRRWGHVA